VAVDGVVAEVGFTADEPLDERRLGKIVDLLGLLVPVDQLGLLAPEAVAVFDGAFVECLVRSHGFSPQS
jgi:hypothetical protein